MTKFYSGIDEAGRGSIFGPLIIVGLTLTKNVLDNLVNNGLKDSKEFSGTSGIAKREKLATIIEKNALEIKIIELPATEIDKVLLEKFDNLNLLEIRNFTKLIEYLSGKSIAVDVVSTPKTMLTIIKQNLNSEIKRIDKILLRTDDKIESNLLKSDKSLQNLIISKKADSIYPIVSAASCVAKTRRDMALRNIENQYEFPRGSLGKGYPQSTDKNVMTFIKSYESVIKKKEFPFIRYSWNWKPIRKLFSLQSTHLDKFFKNQD